MDYFDILKKAWNITWRYKMLWVLGLFAGAASGGSGGGSGYRQGAEDFSSEQVQDFGRWLEQSWVSFAIVVGLLVIIGIAFWVLSVAAQGGLVHGANEAAEGRTPSLRDSWGVGFSKWGRTFMIGFVLGLPAFVVALVMGALLVALGVGGYAAGDGGGAAALVGGMCLILPLFVVIIIALSIVIGIIYPIALRYGVLNDVTYGAAIKRGWEDLKAKRGAFMFWLIMILPGIAFGLAMVVPILLFTIPAALLLVAEKYVIAIVLFALMALVLLVPSAIYGTFVSSAWTIFFRRMTGLEPSAATGFASGSYAPPVAPAAPASYAAPAPPVPPVAYAPSAPATAAGAGEPPLPPAAAEAPAAPEAPIVDVPTVPAEEPPLSEAPGGDA